MIIEIGNISLKPMANGHYWMENLDTGEGTEVWPESLKEATQQMFDYLM